MGLPFAPGWGAELGSSLANIGNGIQKQIDPEKQFRDQFEQHLLTNPELAQHLADLEYGNSGSVTDSMKKFLSPAATGIIRAVPPSMEARVGRIIRDNSDLITKDPTLASDIVSRAMTGQNNSQRTTERAQATVSNIRANAAQQFGASASPETTREVGQDVVDPEMQNNANRLQVAQIRYQYAQTPAEKMAQRIQLMHLSHQLGLADYMTELDARLGAEAQQPENRARWLNSLRSAQTSLSGLIRAYNAHPDDAQAGVINTQVQTLKDYYRLMGATPPDFNLVNERGGVMGVGQGTIGAKRLFIKDASGAEIDPTDLTVPALMSTGGNPPTGTRPPAGRTPPTGNRPPRGNQPPTADSPALLGKMRAQAAILKTHPNITDAQLSTAGYTPDQIKRMRILAK